MGADSEITVDVDGLAPGGDAVGRQVGGAAAGRATFVAGAAPGERVRARLVRERARVAWAELVAVLRPSPRRRDPGCAAFGACGGCQWRHVPRADQLAAKEAIVERALGRPIEVRPAGPDDGYRERARLHVGAGGALGFHAPRSRRLVAIDRCPALHPTIDAALPAMRKLVAQRRARAGADLDVQLGVASGGNQVVAVRLGGATSLVAAAGRIAAPSADGAAGASDVDVAEAGSPPLRIAPGAFAQPSRAGNAALVAAVLEAVGSAPGRVLELHAGSGNFTRHLVARAAEVAAHDGDPAARARGTRNVPAARWPARVSGADAAAADLVLADPPRTGLDEAALALCALARRLVYVSCDPQTLARDARRLGEAGLALADAVALDLMPQTFHVEIVARFERIRAVSGPVLE